MSIPPREHHLQAVDLLLEQQVDGILRLRVLSGSMKPVLLPGDQVLVKPIPADNAQIGDILVLRDARGFLTHRLLKKQAGKLFTKGDAVHWQDLPSPADKVFGRVIAVERNGQIYADLTQTKWKKLSACLARLSCVEGWLFARFPKPPAGWNRLQKCMVMAITLILRAITFLLQSGSKLIS